MPSQAQNFLVASHFTPSAFSCRKLTPSNLEALQSLPQLARSGTSTLVFATLALAVSVPHRLYRHFCLCYPLGWELCAATCHLGLFSCPLPEGVALPKLPQTTALPFSSSLDAFGFADCRFHRPTSYSTHTCFCLHPSSI